MNLQSVKTRFGIVGSSTGLERALATAVRVAPADITVLVRGESGTGKEALPKIIHHHSARMTGEADGSGTEAFVCMCTR